VEAMMERHIEKILGLLLVQSKAIQKKGFRVVLDAVNSTGGIVVPQLLEALGVEVVPLYCDPNGLFPHNPEPLKEHLSVLCQKVVEVKADFGIVVDPDVDRLAFVDETGEMFGEEYTLVSCADYVLTHSPGNTVSNLSSTKALADVTKSKGGMYFTSAVGELNVVEKMKAENAVIGGEGNGGIIYPELHYGRDALVGIALFLSLLVEKEIKVSALKASYPKYAMSKAKLALSSDMDVDELLEQIKNQYKDKNPITIDGVKIEFETAWVHLRKSNTEPIIRVYTEALNEAAAQSLANRFINEIKGLF
jgi:phosphomannomutase